MANTLIPTTGNDACLMVSKFITNINLPPAPATFIGPRGAAAVRDADTFRVQLAGLPTGETPDIRLDVLRGATIPFSHDFNTVEGALSGRPVYRTNEHIRLVSNTVDDAHLAHQTPQVMLEDGVRATLVINGKDITFNVGIQVIGQSELQVGRPPAENGLKAIRTADVNFISLLAAINTEADKAIGRLNGAWAQAAIRLCRWVPRAQLPPRAALRCSQVIPVSLLVMQ